MSKLKIIPDYKDFPRKKKKEFKKKLEVFRKMWLDQSNNQPIMQFRPNMEQVNFIELKAKEASFNESCDRYRSHVGKATSQQDRLDRINDFRCGRVK